MINKPTVFILGAGASKPYGFPTGDGLKDNICEQFRFIYRKFPVIHESDEELQELILKERKTSAEKFTNVLKQAIGQSIDLFLKLNPSHLRMGKIAILYHILNAESMSSLNIKDENWYAYLYSRMMKESWNERRPELINKNNVKFITFNYDRSLEQFLSQSFVSGFSDYGNEEELLGYINKIDVYHIYGSVGKLPWQSEIKNFTDTIVSSYKGITPRYIKYGDDDKAYIQSEPALLNIRLVDERNELDEKRIGEILGDAERIFILGFSFLQENIEMLKLDKNLPKYQGIQIFATTLGMHPERIKEVGSYFSSIKPTPAVTFEPLTCYQMLYKHLWE